MPKDILKELLAKTWDTGFSSEVVEDAVSALEEGRILYFPQLPFTLMPHETKFLSPAYVNPKAKNISYNAENHTLNGAVSSEMELQALKVMMRRFAESATQLVNLLLSPYTQGLQRGRTSFRPVEIKGRPSSYRKDDTRLHVDAFPSMPIQGDRILRVFTNIHPEAGERLWRIGEPFSEVAKRFLPKVSRPFPLKSSLLKMLKMTKRYRTEYDHIMLQIHDMMKADNQYQREVAQCEMRFAPGNTWIVQTDSVSHAAMTGQHLLEQTFYLPVESMVNPERSPLRVLEKLSGRALV